MIEVTLKDGTTFSAADYRATQHYLQLEDMAIPLADIEQIDMTEGVGLKAFWEDELEWLAVQELATATNAKAAKLAHRELVRNIPTMTNTLVAL